MNARRTEVSKILKGLFNLTFGMLVLIPLLPVINIGFIYFFIKYLIEYETYGCSRG